MKKALILVVLLILIFSRSQSQPVTLSDDDLPNISYRPLVNKKLESQVRAFIKSELQADSLFKRSGYIVLIVDFDIPEDVRYLRDSILFLCYMNKDFHSFDNLDLDGVFPNSYCFIENKPVLLFVRESMLFEKRFSTSSKKRFQAAIEPYLAPRIDLSNSKLNAKGNIFRPNEVFQMHGGFEMFFFRNASREPIIRGSHY
ncbi:hypothetical protein [Desertivirga arenae]|uniref:hypothetical protein n=1 Tax=Desertivirga arenae TaxID=2810309 RepID=UPI001A96A909|nr:hypothetical protein [Pedobacter sp. SYSU D00823]